MNREKVNAMLNEIDDKYIEEAAGAERRGKSRFGWRKYAALAACLCLVVTGWVLHLNHSGGDAGDNTAGMTYSGPGIYIEPLELSDTADGIAMDMCALVVYKGGIYVNEGGTVITDECDIDSMMGTYVGMGKGNIDEWSKQSDYEKELASNVKADFYTVKGFDDNFRLCGVEEYEGVKSYAFYERLNGIVLEKGEDIFGPGRLNLAETFQSAQYLDDESWNNAESDYKNIDLDESVWNEFFREIYEAPVEYLHSDGGDYNIYDEAKGHVFLNLSNGTRAELRLTETGYVGYNGLPWIFVAPEGGAFEKIWSAIN